MRDHFITLKAAEADILNCAAFIAERLQSAEGHADAISLIIPQYLKRGDVDLAAELANVVADPFSRDKLLTQVAERCARDGDDDYALQLADAIEEDGLRDQAYENLALIKAENGDFAKAEEIAGAMLHPDYVFAGIAFHRAAAGDMDGSDEALAKIEFPAAEASGLLQIAGMTIEKGDKAAAVEFIDDALAAAEEIEHSEERIRLITEAAQLYREAGETDRSVEAYMLARGDAEVLTNIHRDYFIVVCSLGLLECGDEDAADETLDLLVDKTQIASALVGFGRYYWKNERREEAIEALDEAAEVLRSQKDNETRDTRARNAVITSLAAQFAGFGKAGSGIEIALENSDPVERASALQQIAQVCALRGDDEFAREAVSHTEEEGDQAFALLAMAAAKEKIDAKDEAASLVDEAIEIGRNAPQVLVRPNVFIEAASRYRSLGDQEKARQAFADALPAIEEIRSAAARSAALAELAALQSAAGFELTADEKERLGRLAFTSKS